MGYALSAQPSGGSRTNAGGEPSMTRPPTMSVGPLGSTIHALHADPETIAALAAVDWTRSFPRVCLDPVRGMITLMSPSRQHEDLSEAIGDLVKIAANAFGRTTGGIRSTRLRGPDEPSGTGMEPDCAFYIGERAEGYRSARLEGSDTADAFVLHTAPDLVVEVEITSVDEGKAERYGQMGVREMWRLRARRGSREIDADFLMLRPDAPPRPLHTSQVLEGLKPADVCEALAQLPAARTLNDRMEAVTRIVRRRQRNMQRIRDDAPEYGREVRSAAAE